MSMKKKAILRGLGPASVQDLAVGLVTRDLDLINRVMRYKGLPPLQSVEEASLILGSPEELGLLAHRLAIRSLR